MKWGRQEEEYNDTTEVPRGQSEMVLITHEPQTLLKNKTTVFVSIKLPNSRSKDHSSQCQLQLIGGN